MADKIFTLHCKCTGDACQCDNPLDETINLKFDFRHLSAKQCHALADDIEKLPPEMQVALTKQILATKGTEMTKPVKFADIIASASKDEIIEAISAAAPSMSMEDRLFWIRALQSSAPSKHDSRVNRLNTVLKACAAGDGKAYNAVLRCQRDLRSLDLSDNLDANAESGYAVTDIDKAMKKAGWNTERRIEAKSRLDNLGLLAV